MYDIPDYRVKDWMVLNCLYCVFFCGKIMHSKHLAL